MTRRSPARRATVHSVARQLEQLAEHVRASAVGVNAAGANVLELRFQQAQTETHLANTSNQLARLAEANTRGYATLLEHYNRLEQIVRAIAEGFAVVQGDLDQIQRFVGTQTELLAAIRRAVVAEPMSPAAIAERSAEAARMARATDV